MTEDEREKFDAIRMNLELTGHGLESMRGRVDNLVVAFEANRLACEDLRKAVEGHELEMQSNRHQFADIRDSLNIIREGSAALLVTAQGHERRITKIEART